MIRIVLLIAILLSVCSPSWAAIDNLVSTLGVKNSSNVHPVEVDKDGLVVFGATTPMKLPYTTGSTNQTLTAAQSGTTVVFNNGGATAFNGTMFTLPAAVVGMSYTIVADVAKWFYVKPAAGEIINFSTCAANNRVANTATAVAGDSISLFCATAGQWSVKSRIGTWANAGS